MNFVRKIVETVWPLIYGRLKTIAEDSENQWDDIAVEAINASINAWIESEDTNET